MTAAALAARLSALARVSMSLQSAPLRPSLHLCTELLEDALEKLMRRFVAELFFVRAARAAVSSRTMGARRLR